ncbi:MAG: chemotaxis protein CheX [Candidatus Tectimicrobiota bacterium]
MNVEFINPFLEAATKVLSTMAFTQATPGKPFLKNKTPLSQGDVSGIVGLTGRLNGSMAVSFSEPAILEIVSNMFGEVCKDINDEVRDAVGEISNMISGDARRILAEKGYECQSAIPTVIDGKDHKICHTIAGPVLVMPFTIGAEKPFFIELCLESK